MRIPSIRRLMPPGDDDEESHSPLHYVLMGIGFIILAIFGFLLLSTGAPGLDTFGANPAACDTSRSSTLTINLPELNISQEKIAGIIAGVGIKLHITLNGIVDAEAVALQESGLTNLSVATDHDSLGIFQQRPSSKSWGTAAQIMDPVHASTAFFRAMLRNVPNYDKVDLSVIVARVQIADMSTMPNYYAKQPLARKIGAQVKPFIGGAGASNKGACTGSTNQQIGTRQNGEPVVSDPKRQKVLDAAFTALAKRWPYVWYAGDAHGPTKANQGGACDSKVPRSAGGCNAVGFDCSGLTLYAYAHAGITLGHQTNDQFNDRKGKAVSLAQIQPGDLVFFGNSSDVHHVGIYIGKVGASYKMIDTPTEGQTVMTHFFFGPKDQEGDFAGARRYLG